MIPYKFFSLTTRDETGVLLSNIHRKANRTQNQADVTITVFDVPTENGFLLTSWSIETNTLSPVLANSVEFNLLDAQGNVLSSMSESVFTSISPISGLPVGGRASITKTGSPIAVIGPGISLQGRGRFSVANPVNQIEVSINGVLIPRGTMAYQS